MKTFHLRQARHAFIVCLALSMALSCQKGVDPTNNLKSDSPVPASVLKRIKEMGFDEKTTKFNGKDRYIVEGDIMLPVSLFIDSKGARPGQWSTNNLIQFSTQQVVRIFVDGSVSSWNNAINQAVEDWSRITNCRVEFVRLGSQIDLTFTSDNGSLPLDVIASADFPSNGKAGSTIIINLDFYNSYPVSESTKRYNMVHEMGHTMGLRHTNWQTNDGPTSVGANLIAGTPSTDANSVMNGSTALNSWSGFSAYDITAIRNLYPQNTEISNWISSASTGSPVACQGGGYCIVPLSFTLDNNAHSSNNISMDIYTGDLIYSHIGVRATGNGTFNGYAEVQVPPDEPLRLKITDLDNPDVYDFINL